MMNWYNFERNWKVGKGENCESGEVDEYIKEGEKESEDGKGASCNASMESGGDFRV